MTPELPNRAMKLNTSIWWNCAGLDSAATGFYLRLAAYSNSEPLVPRETWRSLGGTPYMQRRLSRNLIDAGVATREGRDLRLVEYQPASSRWRYFGKPQNWEPLILVSRLLKPLRETIAPTVRQFVIQRDHGTCGLCGRVVDADQPLDIDHILPVARGGKNNLDNLQVSHASCNRRKGAGVA